MTVGRARTPLGSHLTRPAAQSWTAGHGAPAGAGTARDGSAACGTSEDAAPAARWTQLANLTRELTGRRPVVPCVYRAVVR